MAIPIGDLLRMQRRQALRLNQTIVDRELGKILRDAARDSREMAKQIATFPGIGAATRQAQLRVIADASEDIAEKLWHSTGELTREGVFKMADLASIQSLDVDRVTGMPVSFIKGYEEGILASGRISAESIIARQQFGYTLSERVWRNTTLTSGRLSRIIQSGLVNNLSARELSRQVGQFVDPRHPGGASYAAMRLARTEINNAHHWVSADHYSSRPWISGVDWNLSNSHPTPDVCDDFADAGPYPRDEVPDKPHPQCLCFITPNLPNEDEFLDSLLEGEYNEWLEDNSLGKIECHSSCTVVLDNETYQRWDTLEEQEEWLEQNEAIWSQELTEAEFDILLNYIGSSEYYNEFLRRTSFSGSSGVIRERHLEARRLSKAINGQPIEQNLISYRGMDDATVNLITKGNKFTDKGFVSTSLNQEMAGNFGDWVAEIEVPRGTPALGIPASIGIDGEQELLLNRGTSFQILSVDRIAQRLILKVL